MGSVSTESGFKGTLRELLTYKSGIFGLIFLLLLVVISIYAVAVIPYSDAIALWRGQEGVNLENPRNAQPSWIVYFGKNLPETIKLDSSQENAVGVTKIVTPVPGSDIKLFKLKCSFEYDYDAFPSEVNIFFSAKFNESAPLLKIYWEKPGITTQIKLLDYILRSKNDKLYLSKNQKVSEQLLQHTIEVLGTQPAVILPVERALFAVEDETMNSTTTAKPLKGIYEMLIEGTIFGKDSDVDAKLIVYGKIYGLAGTDHLRRDLIVALLWGTPIALAFGLTASLTISILQLILATISGYYGGKIDSLIQRFTEIYMILPFLPILIMIAAFYKFDIWILLVVIVILSVFGGGIKSSRALVMQIKEYPYIEAAKAYGASSKRIIFLYIIPKILPPIVPSLIGSVPGYVFLEAALAFLGLGDPKLPTWGKVINDSFTEGALYKGLHYWVLEPALMLVLTAFAFSFLGFALDKIVNPKLKEI
jgi:peptide/nickel transport system permease protein